MNARGVVVVLTLCLFASSAPAVYAADGWWPDLSGGKPASTASTKKSGTSSWWSWSSSKPKSKSHSKPSTLGKMTRSTKNAWNKTVDFLNPFDDKPAAKPAAKPAHGSVPNTGAWFSSSKSTEKPSSVSEWMAGERPTF